MAMTDANEGAHISPLWLDQPGAGSKNAVANVSDEYKRVAADLMADGVAVVRTAIPSSLCEEAIADFTKYAGENPDLVRFDSLNRETRMVNFHRWSNAALRIGTDPELMRLLDYLFGREACLYTSLTFKYGTQQPIHRDTPHFSTWPRSYFFGMWVALEDVRDDAGPLMYHRGGHRFTIDRRALFERIHRERPDLEPEAVADLALHAFGDEVLSRSLELCGPASLLPVKRGDVVLWHPELPHGGSMAKDTSLTRWSIVFHCAPVAVQVHQHQAFFRHEGENAPPPRYGFIDAYGRKVAAAGGVAFQGPARRPM